MECRFRLGSRGSPLALVQTRLVRAALAAAHGWDEAEVAIVPIRTTGDRVQDRPLAEIGGKALWTKELDRALIDGDIDAAVHSMKDVETLRPRALALGAVLPRADVRDRIVGAPALAALPEGARVGTSAPRRAAQIRRARPDLRIVPFRGNVDTRLAKLAAGEAEATLLAAAGLERLGRADVGTPIPLAEMLSAPAQGVVGIEVRAEDRNALALMAAIDHPPTHACVLAERALLAGLGAGCHTPVAALARLEGTVLTLTAELYAEDGSAHLRGEAAGAPRDPAMPAELARDLLARAPAPIRRLFAP